MRALILTSISLLIFTGCLKKDILDDETLNVNFQESEFYTSGEFVSNLALRVDEIEIERVKNSAGEFVCKPTLTLHLSDDYAADLNQHWSHQIHIHLYEHGESLRDAITYTLSPGYTQSFSFAHSTIECGTSLTLYYRIELISPETSRVSAFAENSQVINTTP